MPKAPAAKKTVSQALPKAENGKVQIRYREYKLTEHLDTIEAELLRHEVPLFQRDGRLTHIVRYNPVIARPVLDENFNLVVPPIRRQPGSLTITDISVPYLRELIGLWAEWYKMDERKGRWVRFHPPLALASHLQGREFWQLNVLSGIAECPTLREDGTIIEDDGYDLVSGIYLDKAGVVYPKIKANPSRADAVHALGQLTDLIKDFPFVPDPDSKESAARSVALSGIITAVVRKSLANAPLHAIDASTPGTGKTKLCDITATIATGRAASALSHGANVEEFDKRVHSLLRTGDPVIMIDNITASLESDQFCTVLTSRETKMRILGESVAHNINTQSLFMANGNNMRVKGDLSVRTIMAKMDAGLEDPSIRTFDRDALQWAADHRPQYVHACLTIVRAYIVAGKPARGMTPSRFPAWDDLVRGALIWLDQPDPQRTKDYVVTVEPERDAMVTLLSAWDAKLKTGQRYTAKELIDHANGEEDETGVAFDDSPAATALREAFHSALVGILPGKAALTARNISLALGRHDRRIFRGMRIRVIPDKKRAALYVLEGSAEEF